MKSSLKNRLFNYLKNHSPEWFASGSIQRTVALKTTYTPRTVVRRLEELAEKGLIEVEYRDKHHAWYRYKEAEITPLVDRSEETVSLFNNYENKNNKAGANTPR